jgi:surfactin synthase thioesterase subunit
MIVTSSTDFSRGSPEYAQYLKTLADAEGWIIVASDATIKPNHDSTPWRLSMLGAAFEAIRKDLPQSRNWPVAFCGHSGGAKRSCLLGAMMARSHGVNICGFFLSGINEDRLGEAYKTYHPGAGLLEVPVWLSSGASDPIATPQAHVLVKASLERIGFKRVRLEQFTGGHQLKLSEVRRALQWFRQLGRF